MPDHTQRFSNRVEYYVRSRPRYPAALLRFFQNELELSPMHVVADIGAGTGILTELFVRNGNKTIAVEPNDAMRAASEEALKDWPNFHSISGTAEATTLADASVDFVTAGQAFHWFDPPAARKEFARILKPAGVVALVWNERRLEGWPFAAAYEKLVHDHHTDPDAMKLRHTARNEQSAIAPFFAPSSYEVREFENPQIIDRAGLTDRLQSASNMPLPPDSRHDAMMRAANELFDQYQVNGTLLMPHDTRVYFGRLT